MNFILRLSAAFFLDRRIMPSGRVNVLMAQYVGYQIDIAGFFVQLRSVRASQLVRRDLLKRNRGFRVLFD